MNKGIVIYHKHCTDGLIAGVVAFNHMVNIGITNITCHEANYGEDVPELEFAGAHVMIVDFSYSPDMLAQISDLAESVVVCDHHPSAVEKFDVDGTLIRDFNEGRVIESDDFAPNTKLIFDKNKSGAAIVRKYANLDADPNYDIVDLVSDRDLWRFDFGEDSKCSHIGLGVAKDKRQLVLPDVATDAHPIELEIPQHYIALGKPIREFELSLCKSISKQAIMVDYQEHKMAIFTCPGALASEASEYCYLNTEADIVLTWFTLSKPEDNEAYVKLSFRSTGNATGMAKEIAERFGGGGHADAAGAKAKLTELSRLIEGWVAFTANGD